MKDLIEREAAIDALMKRDKELRNINWYDKPYAEARCGGIDEALDIVNALPSVHPGCDEWCTDCKEYDQQKHCCPRWNRVIRETVEELKSEQSDFDITVKIDKAYDDGYKTGYLQGRYDWGDLDG